MTREQYAANHPAGRIGKRLTLRVADVMVGFAALPVVPPQMAILDALAILSAKAQASCARRCTTACLVSRRLPLVVLLLILLVAWCRAGAAHTLALTST